MHNDWHGSYDGSDGYGWFTRHYKCGCVGHVGDSMDSEEYSWSVQHRVYGERRNLAAGTVVRKPGAEFWSGEEVTALVDAVHASVCDAEGAVAGIDALPVLPRSAKLRPPHRPAFTGGPAAIQGGCMNAKPRGPSQTLEAAEATLPR